MPRYNNPKYAGIYYGVDPHVEEIVSSFAGNATANVTDNAIVVDIVSNISVALGNATF